MDNKSCSLLLSLDISAAFDMLDIDTLLSRLHLDFGITGVASAWLRSYLTDRLCYVAVGNSRSDTWICHEGVPQGSVLGPLLFSSYVSPIARIFDRFDISYHQYADDTQLYTAVRSSEDTSRLLMCVEEVTRWFLINGLLLNASKTEAIAFGTRQQLVKRSTDTSLKIGDASLAIVDNVKLLGVIFDSTLSMDKQVNAVVKACNFHIRALRHVRSCLTPEAARTISIGLVTSKLDYCNSLLYGTSESNLNKLQRVQNDLARVVLRAPWRCHAAPLLQDLHWLPIRFRITYKVALMTYKVRHSKEPSYLYSLLHDYIPTRVLRSSDQHLLENPKSSTAKASRAFRHSAPVVWNNLSANTRCATSPVSFKQLLKTELFAAAFGG